MADKYRSKFEAPPDPGQVQGPPIDARSAYLGAIRAIQDGIPQAGTVRWLWSNGIVSEGIRINLINFGYMSHPKVKNVEVIIPENVNEGEQRYVIYNVWLPQKFVKRYVKDRKQIQWLSARDGLLWKWLLVRKMEKTETTDIGRNIRRGVREYLGSAVPVIVKVLVEEPSVRSDSEY